MNVCMRILNILLIVYTCVAVGADPYQFSFTFPLSQNYVMRIAAADHSCVNQPYYNIFNENNGDAQAANAYAAAHTKALEHDVTTGLLTANGIANYQQLLTAIQTQKQAAFNAITRAPSATMKFVNPQASCALSLEGIPSQLIAMPLFPTLSSPQAAALIIENYLLAIARDVAFGDYGTGSNTDSDGINGGSITNNAATILTTLGDAYIGPKINGVVTAATLFRGNSAGDLIGPFMSQFVYASIPLESQPTYVCLPYVNIAQDRYFGVTWNDFIALQNGRIPRPYDTAHDFSGTRYIFIGKDIGTWIHNDNPGEVFFYVTNILLKNGFPRSSAFPYNNGIAANENAFVTMAATDIYAALMGTVFEAMKHAWAHKWFAQRVLRPEAFAGLIQQAQVTDTNPLHLHRSIFQQYTVPGATTGFVTLLDWVKRFNSLQADLPFNPIVPSEDAQTYLLSQLYPEGCPVHPSYPSGHATFSGACVTILKAFFEDQTLIKNYITPVKPDPSDPTQLIQLTLGEGINSMTVASELDKLASNIAFGRNFAGIHYRYDAEYGILLGEEVAICYLQDHARIYQESSFAGYIITKRNGARILITPNSIVTLPS